MEKFMFVFEGRVSASNQPSNEEMQEMMGKWFAWIDKLAKSGKYDSGEALLLGGEIIKGNHKTVTDGPFTA